MIALYKTLLGPLLLWQARQLKRVMPSLPEARGGREGCEPGHGPALRLLVVGDSSAAGVGVDHQEQALAQPLAAQLSRLTGRPTQWQLIARSGARTDEAIELVRATPLGSADILVVSLGTNDVTAQRSAQRYIAAYANLIEEIRRRTGVRQVVVAGLPPLHILPAAPQPLRWYLGRYARRLDATLQRWIERQPWADYCSLQWATQIQEMASDRFHPGPRQYATLTDMLAHIIVARQQLHATASPA